MIVKSLEELNRIREECKAMVTKRAATSGVAAIVPIPGTDIVADISILMDLLPVINMRFGLSEEQIAQLDENTKVFVAQIIKKAGNAFVGKVISRELIMQVLKGLSKKIAIKQVLKYIPFAGQVASAVISFAIMKYVGNSHVDDCYEIVQQVLEKQEDQNWQEAAATTSPEESNSNEFSSTSKQEIVETLKMLKDLCDSGVISEDEFQQKKKELLSKL